MIKTIEVKSGKLKELLPFDSYTFQEGLNIIMGRNGSGKSLLLKTIAEQVFIDGNGASKVPSLVFDKWEYRSKRRFEQVSQVDVEWSGDTCFLLDDHNTQDHMQNLGYEMSSGPRIPELPRYMDIWRNNPNSAMMSDYWNNALLDLKLTPISTQLEKLSTYCKHHTLEIFEGFVNDGISTIFLDEVDAHLDLYAQKVFHREFLPKLSEKFQVICASHSYFALEAEGILWTSEKLRL